MSARTFFLAWQDKVETRQWFPVGRLDVDVEADDYRFRYTGGARRAQAEIGYCPLTVEFPELERDYRASALFPTFRNRIMSPRRPDFAEHVRRLGLTEQADPFELLSVNGGRRVTDAYEVFPKLVKNADGRFTCRFFLHGWRHTSAASHSRIDDLQADEKLMIALELTNPTGHPAVQIQTADYCMIGWAPRYLVPDLAAAMAESTGSYAAHVVHVNRQPAPQSQRVLIEMSGRWGEHEPMTGEDFQPLVGQAHVEPDKPPLALPVNPSEALAEDRADRL